MASGGLCDGARFALSDAKNPSLTKKNPSVSMDTLDTQFWKVRLIWPTDLKAERPDGRSAGELNQPTG